MSLCVSQGAIRETELDKSSLCLMKLQAGVEDNTGTQFKTK